MVGKKGKALKLSKKLTTLCVDGEGHGRFEEINPTKCAVPDLCAMSDAHWWWAYENEGLKLAQLRFFTNI